MRNRRFQNTRYMMVIASLLVVALGWFVISRVLQEKSPTGKIPVAAKPVSSLISSRGLDVPKNALSKVSAVSAAPLRNDGTPGKPKNDFLAIKGALNLVLIPTYDGSNQETHPKLLSFPEGWNGYRYWMSMTPYPGTNDDFENPSIVTSNDLKMWVVPKGLKNPVTGVPKDVAYGGHYSDSQIVMNGKVMELWYRANVGNKRTEQPDYKMDYYYRITSTNGITWSNPVLMQSSPTSILSLAILRDDNQYQFWYTNNKNKLMYAESGDGFHWHDIQQCDISLPQGYTPWHQDVVSYNGKYYLLQTALYHPSYSFALFLSESLDGIHFTRGVPFYPSDSPVVLHNTWLYRSTFALMPNGMFQMVISYRLPGNKWFMTQCSLSRADWDRACNTDRGIILAGPDIPFTPESASSASSSHQTKKQKSVSRNGQGSASASKPGQARENGTVSKPQSAPKAGSGSKPQSAPKAGSGSKSSSQKVYPAEGTDSSGAKL